MSLPSNLLEIAFVPIGAALQDTGAAIVAQNFAVSPSVLELDRTSGWALTTASEIGSFTGKARSAMELLAPPDLAVRRLILVGAGNPGAMTRKDWVHLGGFALGKICERSAACASIVAEVANAEHASSASMASDLALGAKLRHYRFSKYKITGGFDCDAAERRNGRARLEKLFIHTADPDGARARFVRHEAVANGVNFARDLINEPANILGPAEFSERVRLLEAFGLEVEVLKAEELARLHMKALLAVAQGSPQPACVCVMNWRGDPSSRARPLVLIGKGVTFDTGGLSIKPSQGMEGMKGDMSGAACVAGLMRALAERKATVNAIGIIGCVENTTSGSAFRPSDIVTSMSGQTIEIINTDAEGRLVLADLIWYAQERFHPKLIVDLATLTGAIMVALGKDCAGLFSNDDELAEHLRRASVATGEKVWRMPLDPAFDDMLSSRFADMKNIGGRYAPACVAAQFIQRFVKRTPWAHLDIAGPAMGAPESDINQSWGAGWGVQLLDHFIAEMHERHPTRANGSER